MITVVEYSSEYLETVIDFCRNQYEKDNGLAAENLWNIDWENKPNTVPYLLTKSERFLEPKGKMHLLFDDNSIIGMGGVYISDFSEKVAIAGVRTWVDRNYRNRQLIKDYILVKNKEWAVSRGVDIIALTFNEYNRNIIRLFEKGQNIGSRTNAHMFHSNINYLDFPVMIQGIRQWVIFENIKDNKFRWENLK